MAVKEQTLAKLRTAPLADVDPEIADLIGRELERQRGQIELIASENFTWPSILEAVSSVPTNKYAEGYPASATTAAARSSTRSRQLAIDRAKELFGAEHANVQPHAGAQTNMAVYSAVLEPGDTVLALRLDHGGHLTHGLKVNFSGRLYSSSTTASARDERRRLRRGARAREGAPAADDRLRRSRPTRARSRADKFREIADEVDAMLLCDMAHFRRPRRRRAAPEPGAVLRLRLLDHAQDALGPRSASSSAVRSTRRRSTAPSSRGCRAGRWST
jgi:glycine hydroxymethyltransferase